MKVVPENSGAFGTFGKNLRKRCTHTHIWRERKRQREKLRKRVRKL